MSSEPQYLCSTSLKEGEKQPLSNCDTHCYQHFNNITTEYKSSVTTVIQIIMQHSGDITCERVSWEQRTSVCFWRDGAERTAPSVWRTYFKRIESNWSCDKGSAGWILGRGSSQKGWSGSRMGSPRKWSWQRAWQSSRCIWTRLLDIWSDFCVVLCGAWSWTLIGSLPTQDTLWFYEAQNM